MIKKLLPLSLMTLTLFSHMSNSVQAHFPWLDVSGRQTADQKLVCYFSESPTDDDPTLLKYVADAKVYRLQRKGDPILLERNEIENEMSFAIEPDQAESIFILDHQLGVMNRGESSFLVKYYSETGPSLKSWTWKQAESMDKTLDFTVIPSLDENKLTVTVKHQGEPAVGAEVTFVHDLVELDKQETDKNGTATVDISKQSIHAVRVKFVEKQSGSLDEKSYDEIRHYSTLTFPAASYETLQVSTPYPEIPETVTSFGAAISGDVLYIYGGHTGGAHEYSNEGQANTLWALDLNTKSEWKALAKGPRLQGLAMVAHDGKLYRIGGFTAKNAEGEDQDLWSLDSFSMFDPGTEKWTDLPALPEPRSSFDAAVLDGKIYVMGGWSMQGDAESTWHDTAWTFDLNDQAAVWTKLPTPPFRKRALSVAAYQGKIYAIGGMSSEGKPTTEVSIYDPKTSTWSAGPQLIGHSMTGFGTSSFAADGQLFVSTYDGTLQTLSKDGSQWNNLGNFENARFFHRMVPKNKNKLLLLGGSSMSVGKFEEIDELDLNTLSKN